MDITNRTAKPLSVPLPGGRKLFLGPGKTGQIADKALAHPPIVKLIESGAVETAEGRLKRKSAGDGSAGPPPAPGGHPGAGGPERHSGDR
jgi:hypothetical protein